MNEDSLLPRVASGHRKEPEVPYSDSGLVNPATLSAQERAAIIEHGLKVLAENSFKSKKKFYESVAKDFNVPPYWFRDFIRYSAFAKQYFAARGQQNPFRNSDNQGKAEANKAPKPRRGQQVRIVEPYDAKDTDLLNKEGLLLNISRGSLGRKKYWIQLDDKSFAMAHVVAPVSLESPIREIPVIRIEPEPEEPMDTPITQNEPPEAPIQTESLTTPAFEVREYSLEGYEGTFTIKSPSEVSVAMGIKKEDQPDIDLGSDGYLSPSDLLELIKLYTTIHQKMEELNGR